MNTLFELFATLGLDATDFKEQAEAALDQSDQVADQVTQSFEQVDAAAAAADTRLDDVQDKSSITQGILEGFVDVTQDVVQEAIQGIIEFGAQSIEAAAGTGSVMAQSFLDAQSDWDLNLQALKAKVGNVLLPAATFFTEVANAITGISSGDRLLIMLDQIDSYSFENLRALEDSLSGVFGLFEEVERADQADVGGMTAGLESQAAYWQEYADTIGNLRSRNIDPQFLADIADGTAESLETLKAIETADAAQLNELMSAYEAVQETKAATAAALNETQLAVDEDLQAMVESVEAMVAGMNQAEAAEANALLTGQGVANGLAAAYPSISSWVSTINATLATIGAGYTGIEGIPQSMIDIAASDAVELHRQTHASGLSYVPYDDYPASLHAGEAVLTRQDAEDWRQGGNGGGVSAADLAQAVRGALDGAVVQMDGKAVGHLVTQTVSREMAREARNARRYANA